MCKHEQKNCPRCNAVFECKPGDITHCQCNEIKLSEAAAKFIADKYADCLCAVCIKEMRDEYGGLKKD
jgi:Cysteine-rich CWC